MRSCPATPVIRHLSQAPTAPPQMLVSMTRQHDMWENAKVEKIICSGLQPPYDGSLDKLIIPMLNLIHIHRKNEVWYPATFIAQDGADIDLILQFS